MEDKLLLLQIAFSIVADSYDYVSMSIDSRVDNVKSVYEKLVALMGDDEKSDKVIN